MLARFLALAAFVGSLVLAPAGSFQGSTGGSRDLIMTRSAEPSGKALYTSSHALIIGVNNYPDLPKNLQLKYAVADATSLRDMLVANYGFSQSSITLLTNEKATLANIRRELSQLASSRKVDADDRILIYFSGHGQTVKLATGGEMGFLIPYDAKIDMNDPNDAAPYLETCLPMKQVWDYLSSSPAKHACVIADACFSGMMASSRSIGMSRETVDAMLARPARQVLTAGAIGQKTFERPDLGHGVFTYKLLEELKVRAVDQGKVFSLMDLYMALQNSVSNMTSGKQIPQFGSVETEGQLLFCSGNSLSASAAPTTTGGGSGGASGSAGTSGSTGGRSAVPTNAKASLTITSTPKANLFIDGAKKGSTPFSMQADLKGAEEKSYQVRLEAKGFIPIETTVTLKPGDEINLPLELKKIPTAPPPVTTASVQIESNPEGANVTVDGREVGKTPYTLNVDLKSKAEKQLKIEVRLTGYDSARTVTTVKRGDSLSVPFDLHKTQQPIIETTPPKRNVKQLALAPMGSLNGNVPVSSVVFSPDGKEIAVSGLDASLSIYKTSGGARRKIEAPKNTVVRIAPNWSKILFVKLLTDGAKVWASVQAKNPATLADLGPAARIPIRSDMAVEDVYAGNDRLILCGSIGSGNTRLGFVTMADFASGQAQTLTAGYRMGQPASSENGSTYAVYVEPVDLRSSGSIVVMSSDLTKQARNIQTPNCNSCAGIRLAEDGSRVAMTGQRILSSGGAEILGTQIFSTSDGSLLHDLPLLRIAAFMNNGGRVLGWRSQIGGPIVELLDMKSGNGLGETSGGELWLSRDEKIVAQANPDGVITLYRLNQP